MKSPWLLPDDFGEQFSISTFPEEGETSKLFLVSTGQSVPPIWITRWAGLYACAHIHTLSQWHLPGSNACIRNRTLCQLQETINHVSLWSLQRYLLIHSLSGQVHSSCCSQKSFVQAAFPLPYPIRARGTKMMPVATKETPPDDLLSSAGTGLTTGEKGQKYSLWSPSPALNCMAIASSGFVKQEQIDRQTGRHLHPVQRCQKSEQKRIPFHPAVFWLQRSVSEPWPAVSLPTEASK